MFFELVLIFCLPLTPWQGGSRLNFATEGHRRFAGVATTGTDGHTSINPGKGDRPASYHHTDYCLSPLPGLVPASWQVPVVAPPGNLRGASGTKNSDKNQWLTLPALMLTQDRETVRQSEQQFARGVELQQKGDLDGARVAYEAALKLIPRRIDALSNLGVIYAKLGQYEQAIKNYKAALAIDSAEQAIRLNLGIAYFQRQEIEPARKELADVVAAEPANLQARQLLGLCLYQLGKTPEAIRELETVYNGQPENIAVAYVLGTAYLQNDQIAQGRVLIDKVFKDLPPAEGHLILGMLDAATRNHAGAVEELKMAIKLNPKLPTVHTQLGTSYLITGNRDLAIQEFRAELDNNPSDFTANVRLGWLLREDLQLDEAEKLLKRALEIRPDDIAALFQYAQLAQARGQTGEAVKLLERAVEINKDFRQAYVLLARLYLKQKRTADADRLRAIIDRLNEEEQKRQPSATSPQEPPKAIDRPVRPTGNVNQSPTHFQ